MKKKQILKLLTDAREVATMENAGFANIKTEGHEPFYPAGATIEEITRLWRETWILDQLDEAIQLIKEG